MPRQLLSAVAAVLCLSSPAMATTVSPVNIEMTPTGIHGRAQITVSNTSAQPIAIEPEAQTTVMNENGAETHAPAGNEFLILPAQALIPAGGTQVFRVQWVGDPQLPESKSYLITMTQLPVQGLQSRSTLAVAVSFGVAVNVAAAGVRPELSLLKTGMRKDKTGRVHPTLLVENPTATHALLRDAAITLSAENWSSTFPPGALANQLGTGLVQPHHRREFVLPVDLPAGAKQVTASIDYRPLAN